MRVLPASVRRPGLLLATLTLLAGCVDSPAAPDPTSGPAFIPAPSLTLAGPDGAPATTAAQEEALQALFDRVDHFHFRVERQDGTLVLDTLLEVTPGQDVYDFRLEVEAGVGETLLVTITALEGETELFASPAVQVRTTATGAQGGEGPTPAEITLSYSGPGASAASVAIDSDGLVRGPGDSGTLTATVADAGGATIPDVPLEWRSTEPAVLAVDADGGFTAGREGAAEVVVTTPTGLEARGWAYVVGGTLAFVEGGVLKTRGTAGGAAAVLGGGAASAPAWSRDGSVLLYADGGAIRPASGGPALADGSWPSVSPDGTRFAFERDGRIWFANLDGSLSAEGPVGSTPVWSALRELVVGGGSIEAMDVTGEGRTTVVPGGATFPAVGPGGRLAWVADGGLHVDGGAAALVDGVTGRPSWSPDGAWLVVGTGGGLVVVPSDGSGPPLTLPGLQAASDPAFQPRGALVSPPALVLSGIEPDPALPGQEVRVLGSGFDDLIAGNNRVFWPTVDGPVEVEVLGVGADALRTTVPAAPAEGDIRVERGAAEATLHFEPALGSLEVRATTPWGAPVPDLGVSVTDGGGAVASRGRTDDAGLFLAEALPPGRYTVSLTAPRGFELQGSAVRAVDVEPRAATVAVTLVPVPDRVTASPTEPTLGVGEEVGVSLSAVDVNGDPIARFSSSSWSASGDGRLVVNGEGPAGFLLGRAPSAERGDAAYTVVLNGKPFVFRATVLSRIGGKIEGPEPGGIEVRLEDGGGQVIAKTITGADGAFRFDGLFSGTYVVRPEAPEGSAVVPASAPVALDHAHPTGSVAFSLTEDTGGGGATRRPGEIVFVRDYQPWNAKDFTILAAPPFNFAQGTDYSVVSSSWLLDPIPSTVSVVILSSLSGSGSPLTHVNAPAAQAHLDSWVREGGWLLGHLADNVGGDGYLVPGLSGVADDVLQNPGLVPVVADHPFLRGPDGALGTEDDATDANVDVLSGAYVNHGSLSGILPDAAEVILREEGGDLRPTYATYALGSGRVVVTTQTLEWINHPERTIINHFWWTLMGGEAPAVVAPRLRWIPPAAAVGAGVQPSDVPVPGTP